MDFGIEGLFDTLDALDQPGIKRAGGGRNLAEAQAPCLFDFGDYRVGMLSFSTTLPLGAEASSDRPGIFPVRVMTSYEINAELLQEQPGTPPFTRSACLPKDLEALDHRIKEARKEADFLIASVSVWMTMPLLTGSVQEAMGTRIPCTSTMHKRHPPYGVSS